MFENSTTYTWWDIEDGVSPLAVQAVKRWEAEGLPKDATEHPMILRVWMTPSYAVGYTLTLTHSGRDIYIAEGGIKVIEPLSQVMAVAAEAAIWESTAELVGESTADKLTEGLLTWLRQ